MRISGAVGVVVLNVVLSSAPKAASADISVIGTGNPAVDVAAVQAAVDAGGVVKLQGRFSFDVPPVDDRTILVTTGVVVEGIPDADGNMPVITGGVKPFQVNAPGQPVAFRALRFVGAKLTVIEVRAADDVVIEHCRIEGVEPLFASAIGANLAIGVVLGFFTTGQVVGDISIGDNYFDIGGTASDRTEAIAAIAVGRADRPAKLVVTENTVRNTVAHGIDIRNIVGRAAIERNDVSTGEAGGQMVPFGDRFVDGIRVLGAGSYLVAHNQIRVGYENAAGIRLQGGPTAPVADAIVFGNDVTMDVPDSATFGSESAGIEVRRSAVGNTVLSNRIRGRAEAAIALIAEPAGTPRDTTFMGNNYTSFDASLADVYIATGVLDTTVIGGQGTVLDQGVGTVIKGGYVTP
jgi:hypothetical protein